MRGVLTMSQAEFDQAKREMRSRFANNRLTFGSYLQFMFFAAAVVSIVVCGAWSVLWALLVAVAMMMLMMFVPVARALCERRLRDDVVDGRLVRAALWYCASWHAHCLMVVLCFAAVSLSVFFHARGVDMPRPLLWICVGGFYVNPLAFRMDDPREYWGHYCCFIQGAYIATVVASVFAPVGPWIGIAAQVAAACVYVPVGYRMRLKSFAAEKIDRYARAAEEAKAKGHDPKSVPCENSTDDDDIVPIALSDLRVMWFPFAVALLSLGAGLAWAFVHQRLVALLLALAAAHLGSFQQFLTDAPDVKDRDEFVRRGLDKDLVAGSVDMHAVFFAIALAVASVAILWQGGRDASDLVALSLLALGSCTIARFFSFRGNNPDGDSLSVVVYAAAFASVVALRIAGLKWWECLLPLPAIGYALPVFRYFFPRSGRRGEARRAAMAAAAAFLADPRSDASKTLDAKMEKRRIRDERRLARFRRSQVFRQG